MNGLVKAIESRYHGEFMTVAIAGSVAVGKSTFANELAEKLKINVAVVSTDDFLFSNQFLQEHQLFDRKGFPETYDLDALTKLIAQFKSGNQLVRIPHYDQKIADIDHNVTRIVNKPDILIIEGVVALQLSIIDFKIYLDATIENIKRWYLTRTLELTEKAKHDPNSWRHQYAHMPVKDFTKLVMAVWENTNQVNLDKYISPSKSNADAIVYLNEKHQVEKIEYV